MESHFGSSLPTLAYLISIIIAMNGYNWKDYGKSYKYFYDTFISKV